MANYSQPDVVNKRVRFYDGQFLQDQDFIDEQKYHLDRERRQSTLLHVTGITEGLMVTTSGAYQVTVAKGVAVDSLGRQLILAAEMTLRLTDKFAKKQDIELYLIYQETETDVAQTGGKGATRWDESPKIVARAPDGTVAVAPDGASTTYEGPSVLLARLAVADNGVVTIDSTVARKAGLSVSGAVGIGTTNPGSDLEIGNFDTRNRYLTLKVGGGNQYRSGVKLWAWQENYGYSVEYDERWATGNGLHVRTHDRNADGATRLFVGWNGNIGIGTTGPEYKLAVSTSAQHLQLRRESTESAGGKQLFLELYQHDPDPKKLIPDVFPSIRFHHNNRFWHRIEAQSSGFHFKDGNLGGDGYSDIKARNISATGKLEVSGGGGTNVDLLVNGRLRSNNNDGGLWVAENRFVGGHSTDQIGFWNNNAWRLTVQSNGNVGIGTTGPPWKLSVSSSKDHMALYREATETVGGAYVFLELAQIDSAPARVPEAFPSIRFHHHNRFWHRIEAQGSGFHFKTGNPASNEYSDIQARTVTSSTLRIGAVTLGEAELAILQKLAAGILEFDLYNVKQDEYAYAADYSPFDNDRRHIFTWRPKGRINQGRWRIHFPS